MCLNYSSSVWGCAVDAVGPQHSNSGLRAISFPVSSPHRKGVSTRATRDCSKRKAPTEPDIIQSYVPSWVTSANTGLVRYFEDFAPDRI